MEAAPYPTVLSQRVGESRKQTLFHRPHHHSNRRLPGSDGREARTSGEGRPQPPLEFVEPRESPTPTPLAGWWLKSFNEGLKVPRLLEDRTALAQVQKGPAQQFLRASWNPGARRQPQAPACLAPHHHGNQGSRAAVEVRSPGKGM